MKNGFNTKNKLDYNGKIYTLNFNAKELDGKRVVSFTYDGQIVKGVKIDGTWTLPRNPTPKKMFDITYKRGDRTGSLNGWIKLSPGGKSGSVEFTLKTPFELVNSLHVKSSYDFVLPNRIIKFDYNRNDGKMISLNFIGSRQEEYGKSYGE